MRSERRKRLSFALISKLRRSIARVVFVRAADLLERPLIGPVDEPDHGFERHSHFETRGTGPFAAGLDPRIVGNGGSNGVGELTSQPVHDVIHSQPPHRRRTWDTGASPERVYLRGRRQDSGDKFVHMKDLQLGN